MKLDRYTVAKVDALAIGWSPIDIEEFAKYADTKVPYYLSSGHCIFVIGRGDTELPLERLTDSKNTKSLSLVLPYDAVTVRVLRVLWLIEITRRSDSSESDYYIEIVGDIGKDAFTGEVRYALIRFSSTIDLLTEIYRQVKEEKPRHLRDLQKKYCWKDTPSAIPKLCDAYIRGALKNRLTSSPAATTTLRKASGS